MPNQTPLNPDAEALRKAVEAVHNETYGVHGDLAVIAVNAYVHALAVAQQEANSMEDLAKAWHAGFCKGEQTAFRERPVNPDTINPYKNGETP